MPKFNIITYCTVITEYVVTDNSPEEAEIKFFDGEFETKNITDFLYETIDKIELIS